MPTYYAQAAGAIQSVVWDTVPTGGGSTLTWPPGAADVLVANGKALTWAAAEVPSLTCARLTTAAEGGTAGGGFTLSGNTAVALTADILAGTSTCLTQSSTGAVTIEGDITGGTGSVCYGMRVTRGTVTVTGTVTGGSGLLCSGIATTGGFAIAVSVYGDVVGGAYLSTNGPACGVTNVGSACTFTVHGTVTGGTYPTSFGAWGQWGPVTIIGSLIDSATCSAVAGKIYWQPASVAHYWQVAWNGANNQRYTIPPLEGNVRLGVDYGYYSESLTGGQLHLPAATDVKLGVGYGEAGTEYTGTLVAGGGGVPLIGPGGLVG